jgi:hypothetical protein
VRIDRFNSTLLLVVVVGLLVGARPVAQHDRAVIKTFQIGGQGGWDYLTVDAQTHRLFVPRTTHTMVIDTESGTIVADIPGQKNAHGVALVPASGRGFISDGGGDGAIVIFDLKTYAVLGTLVAKPDADGIIFDPNSGRVLVVSGREKALMSFAPEIDPTTGTIDTVVDLRAEPEFLAADPAGRVYINLMDTNEVAVVNLKTRHVDAHWPVAPGGKPVGMWRDAVASPPVCGKPVLWQCDGRVHLLLVSSRHNERQTFVSEFALLFRGGVRASSPEGWQEQAQKWGAWIRDLGANGHVKDRGNPLEPSGKVVEAGGKSVTDGPYAGTNDFVAGYMIVEAKDLAHAVELSLGCPIFETGGFVEVRPVTRM